MRLGSQLPQLPQILQGRMERKGAQLLPLSSIKKILGGKPEFPRQVILGNQVRNELRRKGQKVQAQKENKQHLVLEDEPGLYGHRWVRRCQSPRRCHQESLSCKGRLFRLHSPSII
jgi:hypothetical protein